VLHTLNALNLPTYNSFGLRQVGTAQAAAAAAVEAERGVPPPAQRPTLAALANLQPTAAFLIGNRRRCEHAFCSLGTLTLSRLQSGFDHSEHEVVKSQACAVASRRVRHDRRPDLRKLVGCSGDPPMPLCARGHSRRRRRRLRWRRCRRRRRQAMSLLKLTSAVGVEDADALEDMAKRRLEVRLLLPSPFPLSYPFPAFHRPFPFSRRRIAFAGREREGRAGRMEWGELEQRMVVVVVVVGGKEAGSHCNMSCLQLDCLQSPQNGLCRQNLQQILQQAMEGGCGREGASQHGAVGVVAQRHPVTQWRPSAPPPRPVLAWVWRAGRPAYGPAGHGPAGRV
jgi:hypothetical protein